MITIRKGNRILSIPSGAYKTYASAGWVKDGEQIEAETQVEEVVEETTEEPEVEPEAATESEAEEESEEEEEVEYVDPEELKEKPLSELDFEELQILAEYLGIDIKNLKTSKALRAEIKKVL